MPVWPPLWWIAYSKHVMTIRQLSSLIMKSFVNHRYNMDYELWHYIYQLHSRFKHYTLSIIQYTRKRFGKHTLFEYLAKKLGELIYQPRLLIVSTDGFSFTNHWWFVKLPNFPTIQYTILAKGLYFINFSTIINIPNNLATNNFLWFIHIQFSNSWNDLNSS